MKQFAAIVALVGLVDLAGDVVEGHTRCTFPGKTQHCASPDRFWDVEWRAPSGDGGHVLWLKAASSGATTKLLAFERSADLLWAPNGRALAVTDHAGSSESVLWVFNGPSLSTVVNVEDQVRASFGAPPEIFANGHRYFKALRWVNPDLLRFHVRAYDRQPGKEYNANFRYGLSGGVSREPSK